MTSGGLLEDFALPAGQIPVVLGRAGPWSARAVISFRGRAEKDPWSSHRDHQK